MGEKEVYYVMSTDLKSILNCMHIEKVFESKEEAEKYAVEKRKDSYCTVVDSCYYKEIDEKNENKIESSDPIISKIVDHNWCNFQNKNIGYEDINNSSAISINIEFKDDKDYIGKDLKNEIEIENDKTPYHYFIANNVIYAIMPENTYPRLRSDGVDSIWIRVTANKVILRNYTGTIVNPEHWSNEPDYDYILSDATYNKLIELIVDIGKRYQKKEIIYHSDIYNPMIEDNQMVLNTQKYSDGRKWFNNTDGKEPIFNPHEFWLGYNHIRKSFINKINYLLSKNDE